MSYYCSNNTIQVQVGIQKILWHAGFDVLVGQRLDIKFSTYNEKPAMQL